jgi:DNA helicase II / ATP-dependent DNA helicase PcrA
LIHVLFIKFIENKFCIELDGFALYTFFLLTMRNEMVDLNLEQEKAVNHIDGPLLVLAGAGSGKTRIVTQRIVSLIERGVSPQSILAVTFTNKAAGEMRKRVQEMQGHLPLLVCTFHSLCLKILRESAYLIDYPNNFVIYDQEDSDRLVRQVMKGLNIKDKAISPKAIKGLISSAKNSVKTPEEISDDDYKDTKEACFPEVYRLYQKYLLEYQAMDFDDLLLLTVVLFERYPKELSRYQERWRYLLIDEYQDTNEAQYLIAKYLVERSKNLFVVGDPDQSIYSWRGAEIQNILNFEKDYPGAEVVRLEQNYRSRNTILQAANGLIAHNAHRLEKNLWSSRGEGEKISLYLGYSEYDEADYVMRKIQFLHQKYQIPYDHFVIFYRTNFQSRIFEDSLLRERLPYVIIGGISFYHRKEVKDILAWLRMIESDHDFISFVRTVNLPKRGLGEASLEKIRGLTAEYQLSALGVCQKILSGELSLRLGQKQKSGIRDYLEIIQRLRDLKETVPLSDLVRLTIEHTRYITHLSSDPTTHNERQQNVEELIGKALEWDELEEDSSLEKFLEELSLKSSMDEAHENEPHVNLMTLHNGKGLEFDVVFLVGLEESLLPHVNSMYNDKNIEEERRLCYVGMTRAKEKLFLTAAKQRFLWGGQRGMKLSRFVTEIPEEYLSKDRQGVTYSKKPTFEMIDQPVSSSAFSEGDRVAHKQFGVGIVQIVRESSMGEVYDVIFEGDRTKKTLVAKYAKLQKV